METRHDHRTHSVGDSDRIDLIAEALERPVGFVTTPRTISDVESPRVLSPIQEDCPASYTSDSGAATALYRRSSFCRARGNEDSKAQPPLLRAIRKIRRGGSALVCLKNNKMQRVVDGNAATPSAYKQYRVAPVDERGNWWKGLAFSAESLLVEHSLWHYRTTFRRSLLVFLFEYELFVLVFAFIIRLAVDRYKSKLRENCLPGWNHDEPSFMENFPLAMELSWTTFSTVGFGVVAVPASASCRAVRYILAVEAFIGVLFIGYTGALIMAKISRRHATARIIFSSAVCLQYGGGLTDARFDVVATMGGSRSLHQSEVEESITENISQDYPFLEFRIVNERSNQRGGEIVECSIRCMTLGVTLVEKDDYPSQISLMEEIEESRRSDDELNHSAIEGETNLGLHSNGTICPQNIKRTYTRVTVKPDFHPFFAKGGWYMRHILDHRSPFLKPKVRTALKSLQGWPTRLNDHDAIRRCLSTDIFQFSLIFEGKSNLTSTMVFKTHTYKMADIYIGFRFADLGYVVKSDDQQGEVQFDMSLVHDIIPQEGGGNEPLGSRVAEENVLKFLKDGIMRRNSREILPSHSRDSSEGVPSTATVRGSLMKR